MLPIYYLGRFCQSLRKQIIKQNLIYVICFLKNKQEHMGLYYKPKG